MRFDMTAATVGNEVGQVIRLAAVLQGRPVMDLKTARPAAARGLAAEAVAFQDGPADRPPVALIELGVVSAAASTLGQ